AGHHVALDAALDEHISRGQIGSHAGGGTDGKPALGQVNGSFDPAVHNQIFTAFNFAADHDTSADARGTVVHCHECFPSGSPQRPSPHYTQQGGTASMFADLM